MFYFRDYNYTWTDVRFVLQTSFIVYGSFILQNEFDLIDTSPLRFDYESYMKIFPGFYAAIVLKDLFLLMPFHRKMHDDWYSLHKRHHEVNMNAQAYLAYKIDALDLIIENAGANFLLLGCLYMLGMKPRIII